MTYPLITLFTPGNRPELFEKAKRFEPDNIVIDLEDAVPNQRKVEVRDDVAKRLPDLWTRPLVRINNVPGLLEGDLDAMVNEHVYGIILPMAEEVGQVREVNRLMTSLEDSRGLARNQVKLFLNMETALGCYRCFELATASDRVESVLFGSAEDGDLQTDLKCAWSADGPELMYARSKVLLEARAAKLPYVLDGAFSDLTNEDSLRLDCTVSRRLGYDGRTLIYPGHVAAAREIYAPSEEEIAYYRRLVEAFEKAESEGLAAVNLEGKMIDYAMYKKALAVTGG